MNSRLVLLIVIAALAVYSCVLPSSRPAWLRAPVRAVLLAIVLWLLWNGYRA